METGLNRESAEQDSVVQQLNHVDGGISTLEDTISRLAERLAAVLPPQEPSPANSVGCDVMKQMKSQLMEQTISMTSRLRDLNSVVCRLESNLQV